MNANIFGKVLKTSQILGLVLLVSCAGMFEYRPYARNVKKKPNRSGIVALKQEHRQEDRQLAMTMMGQNCGEKKVVILDEGEVAIGTVTQSVTEKRSGSKSQVGSLFGIPMTSSRPASENQSSTTVQKKEWQIQYKCKG